jgi:sulfate-transporting ATPase
LCRYAADQDRGSLNDANTVFQEMSGGAEEINLGDRRINARQYCSWWGRREFV